MTDTERRHAPTDAAGRSAGEAATRCGTVALAGRPNVGKSTLMNHLLGRKLSITSRKPQTTRHALVGVLSRGGVQVVFVDTPGIHAHRGKGLNRYMVEQAVGSLAGVDLALLLIESRGWRPGDDLALRRVAAARVPCVCVITKIDQLAAKERLLPLIDAVSGKHPFEAIVPVSALRNIALEDLVGVISGCLPQAPPLFAPDQVTDRPTAFLMGEIVREKATRRLGAELPYGIAVTVERVARRDVLTEIDAVICVERETQKRIVIGKRGAMLKSIGADARRDIEALIDGKAMLRLWVRVDSRWSDRAPALRRLGYGGEAR